METTNNKPVEKESIIKTVRSKVRNFQLYSIIAGATAVFMAISCILLFVFYTVEGGMKPADLIPLDHPQVSYTPFYDQEFIGGVFFVLAILATILSIVTANIAYPFVMNKDKLTITKALPYLCFVDAAFSVSLIAFIIVLILTEINYLIGGWVVLIVLFAIVAIAMVCIGLLGLQKDQYLPDVKRTKKAK